MALTDYGRKRVRFLLAASRMWITQYVSEAAPCDLCSPTNRVVTRTTIAADKIAIMYRICYKCIAKAHLKREREQPKLERELYLPLTAKRERAAAKKVSCAPSANKSSCKKT